MKTLLIALLFPLFSRGQHPMTSPYTGILAVPVQTVPPTSLEASIIRFGGDSLVRDTTLIFKGLDTIHKHDYVQQSVWLTESPAQPRDIICTICLRNLSIREYYIRKKTPYDIAKEKLSKLINIAIGQ